MNKTHKQNKLSTFYTVLGIIVLIFGIVKILTYGFLLLIFSALCFFLSHESATNIQFEDEESARNFLNNHMNNISAPKMSPEEKALIARRPEYYPGSKEYEKWEKEYFESKLDKVIRYKKQENIFYQFDIDKMNYYFSGKCSEGYIADFYYISEEYYEKVKSYVVNINLMLKQIHSKYFYIPCIQYNKENLCFKPSNYLTFDCCRFSHHLLDYKGKENQTPYSIGLFFGEKDLSHFEVYFDKLGNLKKGRLICWISSKCYIFNVDVYEQQLQIISAYLNCGGQKERIFDYKYEELQERKKEYEWICKNLPEYAPKSLSAYTRMKNSNSANFQKIVKLAEENGVFIAQP